MRRALGFTLIELLAVVAIIALAVGMTLSGLRSFDQDAAVQGAANALAAKLREVRGLAIQNHSPYALAFNIQNAPGSTGAVLNNRTGGHWYRTLGPSKHSFAQNVGNQLLVPVPKLAAISTGAARIWTFPEFVSELDRCFIGEAQSLPAGKVRFLALGDTDEGARGGGGNFNGGYYRARGYAYAKTYPRPWFGYYDAVRHRLFGWGGYDPDLHASDVWAKPDGTDPISQYTGFFYEGRDGVVTGCRNQLDRIYDVDWNHDGDFSDVDPARGPEAGVAVWRKDDPRPLVNAAWLDFAIMFLPDGSAAAAPFKVGRKRFKAAQALAAPTSNAERFCDGIDDTTRAWYSNTIDPGMWGKTYSYSNNEFYNLTAEVQHFKYHTGGFHITLAPDAASDQTSFASAQEALKSLGPIWRVFIGTGGDIRVFRVKQQTDAMLQGLNIFPSSPSIWLGTTAADSGTIASRMRFGWLHKSGLTRFGETLDYWHQEVDLLPTGRTISDAVCPRMMSDKIWWIDD